MNTKPDAWTLSPQLTVAPELWRGLWHLFAFYPGALGYDHVTRKMFPTNGGLSIRSTSEGLAANFDGTGTNVKLGNPDGITNGSQISVFAYLIPDVFGNDGSIFRSAGNVDSAFDLDFNNGSELRWFTNDIIGARNSTLAKDLSAFSTGVPVAVGATLGDSGNKLYINGRVEDSSPDTTRNTATDPIYIGSEGTADYLDGAVLILAVWDYDLRPADMLKLFNDPFLMLRPAGF